MGPTRLDTSKEECRKMLRRMELEAYGAVVSTLRAQGELTKERRKLLEDLSAVMKISPERHKAEIRRAVNDEKLSSIAERLSGGADTEWAWAMEGRRVVPLMPRLVRPTHFTSLASAVTKAVMQNPRICQAQHHTNHALSSKEETPVKYVRDPDDEDTLSPVMIPVASPDSSCHSNNNFDSELTETPTEKNYFTYNREEENNTEGLPKDFTAHSSNPPSVKRPRSPINQVVNPPAPLPKVRAVSPSCVRPPTKPISLTPIQQPLPQLIPRSQVNNPIRPPVQSTSTSTFSSLPANTAKIRVRAPIVHTNVSRPTLITRPSGITQYSQVQANQTRPLTSTATKQVVQIRTTPTNYSSANVQQSKEASLTRPAQTHSPVTVQTIPNVATGMTKQLPGKANVIVLHKNSPMAKTITNAARESDRAVLNKTNFLPKTVSTPTGTKVTFPSNVRIISVPSGANVVSSTGGVGINHTSLAQKIVSSGNLGNPAQKNVYVLELSNDSVGKSIILGDIVPAGSISEVNGTALKTNPSTSMVIKEEKHNLVPSEAPNQLLALENIDDRQKSIPFEPQNPHKDCNTGISAQEIMNPSNGNHLDNQITSIKQESNAVQAPGLNPPSGLQYTMTEGSSAVSTIGSDADQPSVDIFSTAIASADIDMSSSAFGNDDTAGGTELILTDAFDTSSAKS